MKTNAGIWLYTALTVLGSLLLDLQKLMNMPGIEKISDIPQASLLGVLITALLAGVAVVKASITDSPANVQQTNDIVKAAANLDKQSGFARTVLLFVIAIAAAALIACATAPTPNQLIKQTSVALEKVAVQIDLAQKSGQISNEREDHLLDELKKINEDLRIAESLTGDGPAQQQSLEQINQRLAAIRAQLAKEQSK